MQDPAELLDSRATGDYCSSCQVCRRSANANVPGPLSMIWGILRYCSYSRTLRKRALKPCKSSLLPYAPTATMTCVQTPKNESTSSEKIVTVARNTSVSSP